MKTNLFLSILLLLFSAEITAQNILQQKIKTSIEFREAAEKLELEPGSVQVVTTTFLIDNKGTLENITAESEYPVLQIIAINILKSLTKEEVPKHKSSKKQKIILPMKFHVETEEYKKHRLRREARKKKTN